MPYETRRPPGNVPYVVDNLWEWARPDDFPNRRNSKFASPNPQQALRSAYIDEDRMDCVYEVEFVGNPNVAQLTTKPDANDHEDTRFLRKEVLSCLDGDAGRHSWASQGMTEKADAGRLFQPCLTGDEVDEIFDSVPALRRNQDYLREQIDYWGDVELVSPGSLVNDTGEVFFEYQKGFYLINSSKGK